MRKIFIAISFLFFSFTLHAQGGVPYGAYYMAGGVWTPVPTSSSSNPAATQPPQRTTFMWLARFLEPTRSINTDQCNGTGVTFG